MDQRETKQQGGGNGFIFGVIVGVLIALLFTTKKGREILRDVSEKIISKLSKMEQYANQTDDISELFDEIDEEEDYVKSNPQAAAAVQKEEETIAKVEKKAEVKEVKKEVPKAAPKPVEKVAEVKEEEEPSVADRIEALDEPEVKAPEKAIQGRRWFRGLKKKG